MNGGIYKEKSAFLKRMVKWAYPLYLFIIQPLRRHPLVIRCLFKVKLRKRDHATWDFTTLVLKYALRRCMREGTAPVLEIGVGQAALLSLYLARKYNIFPDGIDIVPERVRASRDIACFNGFSLRVWESDLFREVTGKYGLIFWNAAYIPTFFGERHGLSDSLHTGDSRAWDGGGDGTEIIERFLLQAPGFLEPGGMVLLGVNRYYVSKLQIDGILRDTSLEIRECITRPLNPSAVYVIARRSKE